MHSSEGQIISKKTEREDLSQSVGEKVGRSVSEVIVNEDNKKIKEETPVEKRDPENSMEAKNKVSEIKSEGSMRSSVPENEITQLLEGYDEELNSLNVDYVLSEQTPVGVKNIFVRKVLFIFLIETIISLTGSFFMFILNSRIFLGENWYLGLLAIGIILIFGIVVAFDRKLIRNKIVRYVSVPIGIFLVTIAITCLMSALEFVEIMLSHLIFALVFLVALLCTFQRKVPLTGSYGDALIVVLLILGYGIVGAFIRYRHWYYAVTAVSGSAIALYVVIVIKFIVNGKTKEKYTIREYGCVIVLLYIDYIIRIVDGLEYVCCGKESKDKLVENPSAL
ncbi:hypothetical protein MACK_000447 [Theileria orientalis]|uniref:Uncharacterized protein n=1 Tax=Theileria orientalis TaxID=68886 RepID=A0A976M9H4_THEOR|nr:hypothetical protein MACK_000447 [Theileria orientalis]